MELKRRIEIIKWAIEQLKLDCLKCQKTSCKKEDCVKHQTRTHIENWLKENEK